MPKIITHSGAFHCDESLACYLLLQTDQFKDSEIIRTRDPAIIKTGDIVVDVGAVYDPATHRYDHHQREFTGTMNEKYTIKLSSAGLIYKHFGREILKKRYEINDDKILEAVYWKVYDRFILEIDAIDNGVSLTDAPTKYHINTGLSSRVSRLNPNWNKPQEFEAPFHKAVQITGEEFSAITDDIVYSWLPARTFVEEAISTRFSVDPSGKILLLEKVCPWSDHLSTLEKEHNIEGESIYVVYNAGENDWRIQAVPTAVGSFESRKALPEPWRGKRDQELSTLSGVDNCVFIHATGFIGGNKTKEGALLLAKKALFDF